MEGWFTGLLMSLEANIVDFADLIETRVTQRASAAIFYFMYLAK